MPRTRTPIVAVLLVGGAILIFAVVLPLEDLSYFANTVLLLALILVNIALIVHRRKYPNMKRPFRVPFVPLLPALGIIANLYLIGQIFQHPLPLMLAIACLLLGLLGFVAWKGAQAEEKSLPGRDSHVAHSQGKGTSDKKRFRILVPISNPYNVENLMHLASSIAKDRNGEIWLLRVVTIPEQLPPTSFDEAVIEKEGPLLKQARRIAEQRGVSTHALIRVGHNVARAVLETSHERSCGLIILGWKGYSSNKEKMLGTITDDVVRYARTDILLAKIVGDDPIRRILLPTAGGEHARCAEQYSTSIIKANYGSVTVCQVAAPGGDESISQENIKSAMERIQVDPEVKVDSKLIRSDSIPKGIAEAAQEFDAVIVGAAGKSIYPQIMFGNIPEEIARNTDRTVIVVKHYHPVKALLGRVVGE